MAIAVDKTKGATLGASVSSITMSFASLPAAGSAVFVFFTSWHTNAHNQSVSDNQGNTYTLLDYVDGFVASGSVYRTSIYYCAAIGTPSGTFTVTTTSSQSGTYFVCSMASFTGCKQNSFIRYYGHSSQSSVTSTDANKTSDSSPIAGDLVLAVGSLANSSNSPIGSCSSGYTNIGSYDDYTAYGSQSSNYKIASANGAQSASWSHADNRWGVIMAVIQPPNPMTVLFFEGN